MATKTKSKIKFELTPEEYEYLSCIANDGRSQKQTPDELAHDVVVMYLLREQAASGQP